MWRPAEIFCATFNLTISKKKKKILSSFINIWLVVVILVYQKTRFCGMINEKHKVQEKNESMKL